LTYIENPNVKDTTCINDINKAKQDIDNGKIIFCSPTLFLRSKEELKEVVANYGLVSECYTPEDCGYEGQTEDCYYTYMTKYVNEKFGCGFRSKIYKEADSLYLSRVVSENRIVLNWDCDTKPHTPGARPGRDESMSAIVNIPVKQYRRQWKTSDGEDAFAVYRPFMDITFKIDTSGNISNFKLNNFNPELPCNKKFEAQLYKLGVEKIKLNPIWIPGMIRGVKVNTWFYVRVDFKYIHEKSKR
jgi:hypothetical protein